MMFDLPDYPYKDLSDTLRDHYDPDELLLTTNDINHTNINKNLAEVAEQMISSVENQLSFHSNDAGRYFNVENTSFLNSDTKEQDIELSVVQNDNLFNYESTLLDDNTVNQFLLPLPTSSENKEQESSGPDLLALHSCVICHDIFTTDADLLDHTILVHASVDILASEQAPNTSTSNHIQEEVIQTEEIPNAFDFEAEWLVCAVCERVLSTALEVEPSEQLCCDDGRGRGSVSSRKLHTMYVCDFCSGLFADGDALDKHRLTCYVQDQTYFNSQTTDSNPSGSQGPLVCFSCDTCGKQYQNAEDLKSHNIECQRPNGRRRQYSSNSNNKMWNCGSCNQLFATARELYRHKRGEDRPAGAPLMAYVCEECDKVLGSMCALHTHKKMHKVSKPGYPCRVCGRRFNQSGHLAIHMRMHTGERPYPCDLCPKAFKVKVERDDHRRTHTGERPFACTACPKTFTAAARLREHARIHTDQRPYRCDICGASFRRPYARTVHTLIHTGEKPHECDVCGTAFRRSGDMWKHKRTLHGTQHSTEA